jgi:cytoskeletal protein RodZ
LESIDNGLVDELPEPVYVAGYIKRYADCVGLNGQNLSDEYRKQNGGGSNGNKSNGATMVSSRMVAPVIMSAPSYNKGGDYRPPNVIKQGLFYALMIVTVVGIMAILSYWQSNYSVNQTDPTQALLQRNYHSAMTAPAQQVPGQPTAVPDTTAPAPLTDGDAAVAITASQHVWVEVSGVSTGQNLYTGFMERGERKDYKDPQGIRVHAGNGASLTIENQGKSETLGAPGKIAEKVFMSKNAATATPALDPKAQAAAAAAAKSAMTVKKVIKRPVADAAPRKRAHTEDSGSSAGAGGGNHSSIDVPYRYTESND